MTGRSEFFAAQAKHAQRKLPYNQKSQPVNDDVWFSDGLMACRSLHADDPKFGKAEFAALMGVSESEAERRLRVLTRKGVLYMGSEKSPEGTFRRFTWELRQPEIAELN